MQQEEETSQTYEVHKSSLICRQTLGPITDKTQASKADRFQAKSQGGQ